MNIEKTQNNRGLVQRAQNYVFLEEDLLGKGATGKVYKGDQLVTQAKMRTRGKRLPLRPSKWKK